MKIQIHHLTDDGGFVHAANVTVSDQDINDALESAFALTQNLNGSWAKGSEIAPGVKNDDYRPEIERVQALPEKDGRVFGLRSSMVGDLFYVAPVGWFAVAGFGFRPADVPNRASVPIHEHKWIEEPGSHGLIDVCSICHEARG